MKPKKTVNQSLRVLSFSFPLATCNHWRFHCNWHWNSTCQAVYSTHGYFAFIYIVQQTRVRIKFPFTARNVRSEGLLRKRNQIKFYYQWWGRGTPSSGGYPECPSPFSDRASSQRQSLTSPCPLGLSCDIALRSLYHSSFITDLSCFS